MQLFKLFGQCRIKIKNKTIENLAYAFLHDSFYIGVFEQPALADFQKRSIPLISGILPEMEPGYLSIADSVGIQKLNVVNSIKGIFDNLIFLPLPAYEAFSDPPDATPPEPAPIVSGSKWVLILKSGFGLNNEPLNDWVLQLKKTGNESYINSKTVFVEAFDRNSSICILWPQFEKKVANVQMGSEELIVGLEEIQNALSLEQQEKKNRALDNIIQKYNLKSSIGIIAQKIKEKIGSL